MFSGTPIRLLKTYMYLIYRNKAFTFRYKSFFKKACYRCQVFMHGTIILMVFLQFVNNKLLRDNNPYAMWAIAIIFTHLTT